MYAWNKNRGTDTFRDTYETIDWNRIIKCGSISKFGVLKKKKEKKTKNGSFLNNRLSGKRRWEGAPRSINAIHSAEHSDYKYNDVV